MFLKAKGGLKVGIWYLMNREGGLLMVGNVVNKRTGLYLMI